MQANIQIIPNKIVKKVRGSRKYLITKTFWNCDILISTATGNRVVKAIDFMANQTNKRAAMHVAQDYKLQIKTNLHLYV